MSEKLDDSTIPNDQIDIYGEIDVSTKRLTPSNDREFKLLIQGYNIDYSIINAIRRTIMMSIPVYSFHRSNIQIDSEKSYHMYNNDLLYNQIETLPIFDIPNYFDLEDPQTYLPTEIMKRIFGTFVQDSTEPEDTTQGQNEDTKEDTKKKLLNIELTISIKNTAETSKFVSTHDAILKINGKVSNSYQNRKPISIMVLKPREELHLKAQANLGISKMSAIYEATTNAIHRELSPTKYELEYETLEQLNKDVIYTKALTILIKKLEALKRFIKQTYAEKEKTEKVEIQLYGEDHTLGNLLATILQKCEFIVRAGYVMPHPFVDQVNIVYQLSEKAKGKKPIGILIDSISYLIKLFTTIRDLAK